MVTYRKKTARSSWERRHLACKIVQRSKFYQDGEITTGIVSVGDKFNSAGVTQRKCYP
jgi:hypothetical protein